MSEAFDKLPLYFIENQGQINAHVPYYIQGRDKTIYFTSQGLTFALAGKESQQLGSKTSGERDALRLHPAAFKGTSDQEDAWQRWVIKLDFVDANSSVKPTGQDPTPAVISYFKGSKDRWQRGLKTYATLVYTDLWPGIDLIYSGTVNRLKYTFVVKPGADPNQIKLAYRGVTAVSISEAGQLEVSTPRGGFHDEKPYSYQELEKQRVQVATAYSLDPVAATGTQVYGFRVGTYDKSKPLVLDPAVLVYAGFIGGSGNFVSTTLFTPGEGDVGNGIAVDKNENAYVTGTTNSTKDFPVFTGPDTNFNGGGTDAFVAKVKSDGTGLVYCGYIGGSDFGGIDRVDDTGEAIAVDSDGRAYITGTTVSSDFPRKGGPSLMFKGFMDAFVVRVNKDGTDLEYAGFIGGTTGASGISGGAITQGTGIAVDDEGSAYVTGFTDSSMAGGFPAKLGPRLIFKGMFDAFVAKVNKDGTGLTYCGYIGGSSHDFGNGIAVDSDRSAYVAGTTQSDESSFPTKGGLDDSFNGASGTSDAFVAKVRASGTDFDYVGYIGGTRYEEAFGIAVDKDKNAYVIGTTDSTKDDGFPVKVGPETNFKGLVDAFIAKVNKDGTDLIYCGYIGGKEADDGRGVAVDSVGNAYVTGFTRSDEKSFPVKDGPTMEMKYKGFIDAFVAKVQANGAGFDYAFYIGGDSDDKGKAIAVDGAGNAYITGKSGSTKEGGFPVKVGPELQNKFGLNRYNAFVAKIATAICPPIGPGLSFSDASPVSDQQAGSVLIYNIYTSSISAANSQNTRINLTNTNQNCGIAVHLFFVDGNACSVADSFLCLTAGQTASFITSDLDPGVSGYIVAVAVDGTTGCPVSFNFLIGDEYVKFSTGHAANLGAEAFSARYIGIQPGCNSSSITAELVFDGFTGYNRMPRVLALDNLPSRSDNNDTLLVVNRLGGNLAIGAATLGTLFGILYDDAEHALSFSMSGSCQLRGSLSNTFPRTVPRLETFIPAGRSGWLKLFSQSDVGLLGAAINFNPSAGTSAGAFNQGHNLHKLTLSTSNILTVPIFPPGC